MKNPLGLASHSHSVSTPPVFSTCYKKNSAHASKRRAYSHCWSLYFFFAAHQWYALTRVRFNALEEKQESRSFPSAFLKRVESVASCFYGQPAWQTPSTNLTTPTVNTTGCK